MFILSRIRLKSSLYTTRKKMAILDTPLLEVQHAHIPLGTNAHEYANSLTSHLDPSAKPSKYINALAVYAVHRNLRYIEIESDLKNSKGSVISMNTLFGISSLHLNGYGDIECCVIKKDCTEINIPELAKDNILGLAVCLVGNYNDVAEIHEMSVIGFTDNIDQLPLAIANLPTFDSLIGLLEKLDIDKATVSKI